MSEPNHSSDLPAAIFPFHGDVYGFVYSANPQGNVVGCVVNPAPATTPSGSHAAHAKFSGGTAIPPLSSSSEGNQDADGITSVHSTPTVHYDFEVSKAPRPPQIVMGILIDESKGLYLMDLQY